eukprot:8167849-Alexandrium_andersonii.AAC.1
MFSRFKQCRTCLRRWRLSARLQQLAIGFRSVEQLLSNRTQLNAVLASFQQLQAAVSSQLQTV